MSPLHPGSVDRSADEPGQTGITDVFESAESIRFFPVGDDHFRQRQHRLAHTTEADVPKANRIFAALYTCGACPGFGTSDSGSRVVAGTRSRCSSMGYGADAVPLHAAGEGALFSHWIDGLRSAGLVDLSWQPTTMGPYLSYGEQMFNLPGRFGAGGCGVVRSPTVLAGC